MNAYLGHALHLPKLQDAEIVFLLVHFCPETQVAYEIFAYIKCADCWFRAPITFAYWNYALQKFELSRFEPARSDPSNKVFTQLEPFKLAPARLTFLNCMLSRFSPPG